MSGAAGYARAIGGGAAEGILQIFGLGWVPTANNPNAIVDRNPLNELQDAFKNEQSKFEGELKQIEEKITEEKFELLTQEVREMGVVLEEDNIQLSDSQDIISIAQMTMFVIVMFIFLYLLFA